MTTKATTKQRTVYDDFIYFLELFSKAKKIWNNVKRYRKWDVQFAPYRVNFHNVNHKLLSKKVKLSDNFIRHYFPVGEKVMFSRWSNSISVKSSKYDPQLRKGIVRFKVMNSYKGSTKNLVSNIREYYGDATKKKWQGSLAGDTWTCGDLYYTNQLKYAILPSFEKIRKVGNGLWEATFVPYQEAHTIMKSIPLTKTEEKYGLNILKHLLPEKNGWFGHKFNQGIGHVYTISNSSPKDNLIKSKLFTGNEQNLNNSAWGTVREEQQYFKRNRNVYGLKLL